MTATIIDGKKIAAEIRSEVAERVRRLAGRGVTPGFVDLLIGDDPASKVYVGMKYRAATEAGMSAFDHLLPARAPRGRGPGDHREAERRRSRPRCDRAEPSSGGIA